MARPKDAVAPMHLFRGAPSVRSWSKYQETMDKWALCGVYRSSNSKGIIPSATEDPKEVTCQYCQDLMR